MPFRYKFDDERVTKEDMKKAVEELYGGEEEVSFPYCYNFFLLFSSNRFFVLLLSLLICYYNFTFLFMSSQQLMQTNPGINNTHFKFTKHSNAYMLVYIRETDKDKIMCHVDEKDIAEHLRVRC